MKITKTVKTILASIAGIVLIATCLLSYVAFNNWQIARTMQAAKESAINKEKEATKEFIAAYSEWLNLRDPNFIEIERLNDEYEKLNETYAEANKTADFQTVENQATPMINNLNVTKTALENSLTFKKNNENPIVERVNTKALAISNKKKKKVGLQIKENIRKTNLLEIEKIETQLKWVDSNKKWLETYTASGLERSGSTEAWTEELHGYYSIAFDSGVKENEISKELTELINESNQLFKEFKSL